MLFALLSLWLQLSVYYSCLQSCAVLRAKLSPEVLTSGQYLACSSLAIFPIAFTKAS